jgi:hypothetical protein
VDAGTDGLDDADAVLIRYLKRELRISARSRFPVGRIDSGEMNADEDLSCGRLRLRDLVDEEHLVRGTTALVERRDQQSSAK